MEKFRNLLVNNRHHNYFREYKFLADKNRTKTLSDKKRYYYNE